MKRKHALFVLILFAAATLWTSVYDYQVAHRQITDDLTQALALTQAERPDDWLSTDTIRQYRDHLVLPELQRSAVLMFCLVDDERHNHPDGLSGRSVNVLPGVKAYGRVTLSAFDVWRMGDHRLSLALSILTLAWMLLSLRLTRRVATQLTLTPMQEQLINLLLAAPGRQLPKQAICDALWPGKPDASETLYTLVRRTKQALSGRSPLRIISLRGRAYCLDGPSTSL